MQVKRKSDGAVVAELDERTGRATFTQDVAAGEMLEVEMSLDEATRFAQRDVFPKWKKADLGADPKEWPLSRLVEDARIVLPHAATSPVGNCADAFHRGSHQFVCVLPRSHLGPHDSGIVVGDDGVLRGLKW